MYLRSKDRLSSEMSMYICSYYEQLYKNYERQSMRQIAFNLNIDPRTVSVFVETYNWNLGEGLNGMYNLIMLCTVFRTDHEYYDEQQEKFGKIIEEREKMRKRIEVYNKFKPLIEKSKEKSKKL